MKRLFSAQVDLPACVDACWVRSGWCYDTLTLVWRHISDGCLIDSEYQDDDPRFSPGATLAVPLHLAPGESRRVTLRLNWYVPHSGLHAGIPEAMLSTADLDYQPWYASRFSCIDDATADWAARYGELRRDTLTFSDALFDSDLPDELLEAVADTLSVLKSPTVLRQKDGRFWAWEGSENTRGFLPWFLHACVELSAGALPPFPAAGTFPARNGIFRFPKQGRAPEFPFAATDSGNGRPWLPRCQRRPVGRHHQGLSGLAYQRRRWLAKVTLPPRQGQSGLLHWDLGSGPQGLCWIRRTTTPTILSFGVLTACVPAFILLRCRRSPSCATRWERTLPPIGSCTVRARAYMEERPFQRRILYSGVELPPRGP